MVDAGAAGDSGGAFGRAADGSASGRFGAFLAPVLGPKTAEAGSRIAGADSEHRGGCWSRRWAGYIADRIYRAEARTRGEPGDVVSGSIQLAGPTSITWTRSTARLHRQAAAGDVAILPGVGCRSWPFWAGLRGCWEESPMLGGAILQRWQSGNLRSYAAWLAFGAAALLLFVLLPGRRSGSGSEFTVAGTEMMHQ